MATAIGMVILLYINLLLKFCFLGGGLKKFMGASFFFFFFFFFFFGGGGGSAKNPECGKAQLCLHLFVSYQHFDEHIHLDDLLHYITFLLSIWD